MTLLLALAWVDVSATVDGELRVSGACAWHQATVAGGSGEIESVAYSYCGSRLRLVVSERGSSWLLTKASARGWALGDKEYGLVRKDATWSYRRVYAKYMGFDKECRV